MLISQTWWYSQNYAKKEEGKHFEGKCFVFDDRLIVPVNPNKEAQFLNVKLLENQQILI